MTDSPTLSFILYTNTAFPRASRLVVYHCCFRQQDLTPTKIRTRVDLQPLPYLTGQPTIGLLQMFSSCPRWRGCTCIWSCGPWAFCVPLHAYYIWTLQSSSSLESSLEPGLCSTEPALPAPFQPRYRASHAIRIWPDACVHDSLR
jgi:hypothetical protein